MRKVALSLLLLVLAGSVTASDLSGVNASVIRSSSQYCEYLESSAVVVLPAPRKALSTIDGFREVQVVANNGAESALWKNINTLECEGGSGYDAYLRHTRARLGRASSAHANAVISVDTGVDVANSLAIETLSEGGITVTVLATAGVDHNALRAGTDRGKFLETGTPGTINLIILTSHALTDGAMVRTVMTATEAKSAALQDLDVRSVRTPSVHATGTGTDQVVVISGSATPALHNAGGHAKLGELIGKAVSLAVKQGISNRRLGLDWGPGRD